MAERLIRIGKVSSVNAKKGLIEVTYPDLDDAVTDEFPVFSFTDEYKIPGIGQDVLVLHLSNGQSAGVVLGKFWCEDNLPPVKKGFRKEFGSEYGEAFMQYNDGTLTIQADKIKLKGPVTVTGDVTADGISLEKHKHTDSEGGNTSAPK